MLTATGAQIRFELILDSDVSVLDIAHGLAQINRFCGHARRPYSVAEHSVLVSHIMARDLRITDPSALLAGLLHDAHECYVGDMPTPVKARLGAPWHALEAEVQRRVQQALRIVTASAAYAAEIKCADLIALATERRDLMADAGPPWPALHGVPCATGVDLGDVDRMESWQSWRQAFLDRYAELAGQRRGADYPNRAAA